jgi:hypothetical protein
MHYDFNVLERRAKELIDATILWTEGTWASGLPSATRRRATSPPQNSGMAGLSRRIRKRGRHRLLPASDSKPSPSMILRRRTLTSSPDVAIRPSQTATPSSR